MSSRAPAIEINLGAKDPAYADFIFIVGGLEFKIHRNILAASSPVMHKIFTSRIKEAEKNEYTVDAIAPETFDHLLKFIYEGELPNDFKAIAKPLYEAAHYYDVDRLKTVCAQKINVDLTLDNALEVFEWVQPYDDFKQLKLNAWAILKRQVNL